jgi:predicted DCC family thiol-disulfide oxidoreductase YuxK
VTRVRWTPLVLLLIIVGIGVWVARHTYWDYVMHDNPMKGEALTNPFYTFEHLAQRLGIRTQQISSLRTLPPAAGVLLVSDLHGALLRDRLSAVKPWVEAGGRLLVSRNVLLTSPTLQSWSGITLALHDPVKDEKHPYTRMESDGELAPCPELTERVGGEDSGRRYRACITSTDFSLASKRPPAWSLANDRGVQMLRVGIGKGSIAVIVCECVVENRSLLHDDHARLVFAAVPLASGDQVSILNPKNAEGLLSLLWRGGSAAIICAMLAVALAIWRNLPRFGALVPMPAPLRRSLAEQIRAKARFAWRTRKLMTLHQAQRRALESAARRLLPAYDRLNTVQRIGAVSSRSGVDAAALSAALAYEFHGGAEAELAAISLLETARRALESQSKLSHGTRL